MKNKISEFLDQKLKELTHPTKSEDLLNLLLKRPSLTIRTNVLKIDRKELKKILERRGVKLKEMSWNDEGLTVLETNVPIGATPEYLAGYYCIQGGSSMIPTLCLDVNSRHVTLDMCASPGGKTSHIAALMSNMGVLLANDISEQRMNSLIYNLNRMGIKNTVVSNLNGKKISNLKFHRILLDAPCSGSGVISKEEDAKLLDINKLKSLTCTQKELILNAFDILKNDGILVYSTCSLFVEENEAVINYLLEKRSNAKLQKININVGESGFKSFRGFFNNSQLAKCKRIWPGESDLDGFFIAKIRKI